MYFPIKCVICGDDLPPYRNSSTISTHADYFIMACKSKAHVYKISVGNWFIQETFSLDEKFFLERWVDAPAQLYAHRAIMKKLNTDNAEIVIKLSFDKFQHYINNLDKLNLLFLFT